MRPRDAGASGGRRSAPAAARRLRLAALVAVAALAPLGPPAVAQGPAGSEGVVVLTLEEALLRASDHNPAYRRALNQVELAGPQAREALGAFLPSLSLSYGTGQSFRREATAVDFFGNVIDNAEPTIRTSSSASQSLSLGIDLLQGGGRFHEVGRARAQASADRWAAERELNAILAEVQRQFLIAQRQKARLRVEIELLAARERDVDVARRRFELASIGQSDLMATELELATQRTAVTQAQGALDKGLLALRRVIGDPALADVDVAASAPEPFDPATLDIDALVAEAVRESPQVGAAKAALAASQSALRVQRATRWPSLSLSSSLRRGSYGPERSALFDVNPSDFAGSLSLSVSIPVFRQFRTTRAIAAAEVDLRNQGETVRQTELELEETVRTRYVDLETAWATVRERSRRLEIAEARLAIVQEEYRLATKSIEDLRAAVREEAFAQRDALDQSYEFAVALVGLYEAAGVVGREAGLGAEPLGER